MKQRNEVPSTDQWNIEVFYPTVDAWLNEFQAFKASNTAPYWPSIQVFQGKLQDSPEKMSELLAATLNIERQLTKLYTYAHLRHDEDIANPEFKTHYEKIVSLAHAFAQETAWIQPEILNLPENITKTYLDSPILADYRFYLEKLLRVQKHTLSKESEQLLALASEALQTPYKAFNAISDADFKFPSVANSLNEEKPLTHGTYGLYIRDQDRNLRKNAFETYHKHYLSYENTLCELLNGQVRNHCFEAKARHYDSCLDAALFPKNIETSVYHALIKTVNERLPVLHRYMAIRKRMLKLDKMHLYDLHVPLTNQIDIKMPYEDAENLIIEAVKPLGEEYVQILKTGLKENRWVDRFENSNKRSGAYSSGCFDSMPYILMNYKNILRDVFTLAHEAGHSMHSYFSRHAQPYHYSDYPIFLAEVASTFNEDLLTRHLISKCQDPHEKFFLINQKIEDIRSTLFRQTMFAEFELLIHTLVEQNTPLTPQLLKEKYRELNSKYFGPSVVIDEQIDIEWSRIPHFYYNFYVFQYATGISAALALAAKVINGGNRDREAYLTFLKSGSSKYPIDTLKLAGIDMTSQTPVNQAIDTFEQLLTELENLYDSLN